MLVPHLKLLHVLFEMCSALLTFSIGENSIKKIVTVFTLLSHHLVVLF